MTKWNRAGFARLVAALLCAVCALGGLAGVWAGEAADAPEAREGLVPLHFGDTGFTVMLPFPYTRCRFAAEEEDFVQLVAHAGPEDTEPYFVLTAVKEPRYGTSEMKEIGQIGEAGHQLLFSHILHGIAGPLDWQRMVGEVIEEFGEEFGESVPVMRFALEGDDALGRHIAGIRDGWVMVLSLLPGSENATLDGLDRHADVAFYYMMVPYEFAPGMETVALPGTSLTLTLPEGMTANMVAHEVHADRERAAYHIMYPAPEEYFVGLVLLAFRHEEFQGNFLHEFELLERPEFFAELGPAISSILDDQGELLDYNWLHADTEHPLLQLQEVVYGYAAGQDYYRYHLLAMKDGWLIDMCVSVPHLRSLEELLTMQMHFMNAMLAGDSQAPSLEPQAVIFDTLEGRITLDIPYGYESFPMRTWDDMDLYKLVDLQEPAKRYMISFFTDEALAGSTIDDHQEWPIQDLQETAGFWVEERFMLETVADGVLGVPTTHIFTESRMFSMSYLIIDGCKVSVGIQSLQAPVTQEDIDRISDLLQITL